MYMNFRSKRTSMVITCVIVIELPMPMVRLFLFQQIKAIADTGVNLIVTGGKVGELALHYANKHKLMIIRLMSKFDLRRLCKAIGATALPRIVSISNPMMYLYCGKDGTKIHGHDLNCNLHTLLHQTSLLLDKS